MKIAFLRNNEIFVLDFQTYGEMSLGIKAKKMIKIENDNIIYLSEEDNLLYKKSIKNAEKGTQIAPYEVTRLLTADSERVIYLKKNKIEIIFLKSNQVVSLNEKNLKNIIIL